MQFTIRALIGTVLFFGALALATELKLGWWATLSEAFAIALGLAIGYHFRRRRREKSASDQDGAPSKNITRVSP